MKGIYLLEIAVERDQHIRIGALGRLAFGCGTYVYVGSAQRGLEQRIARHCRKRKKKCWHIDYLLSARGVTIRRVFSAEAEKSRECDTARLLAALGTAVPGFGCSDCACMSHLFRMPDDRWPDTALDEGSWRTHLH